MSRATGTAVSLALTTAGAVLAFASNISAHRANTLGWVLMQIGVAGLLLAFMIGDAESEYPSLYREREDATR